MLQRLGRCQHLGTPGAGGGRLAGVGAVPAVFSTGNDIIGPSGAKISGLSGPLVTNLLLVVRYRGLEAVCQNPNLAIGLKKKTKKQKNHPQIPKSLSLGHVVPKTTPKKSSNPKQTKRRPPKPPQPPQQGEAPSSARLPEKQLA